MADLHQPDAGPSRPASPPTDLVPGQPDHTQRRPRPAPRDELDHTTSTGRYPPGPNPTTGSLQRGPPATRGNPATLPTGYPRRPSGEAPRNRHRGGVQPRRTPP